MKFKCPKCKKEYDENIKSFKDWKCKECGWTMPKNDSKLKFKKEGDKVRIIVTNTTERVGTKKEFETEIKDSIETEKENIKVSKDKIKMLEKRLKKLERA